MAKKKKEEVCFDLSDFVQDRTKSVEGREVSYPGIPGATFRIASMSCNPPFQAAVLAAEEEVATRKESGEITEFEEESIRLKPYADHILLWWSDGVKANDVPIEPTPENRHAALVQAQGFANWVVREARNSDEYRGKFLETAEGN